MNKDMFMRLYNEGRSDSEIAEAMFYTVSGVYRIRKRLGLPYNDPKEAERMRLWEAGLDEKEIAEKLGIKIKTVMVWRRKHGLKLRAPHYRSISESEHNERYRLWQMGYNDREIGEKLGLSVSTVYYWRKKWNIPVVDRSKREELKYG